MMSKPQPDYAMVTIKLEASELGLNEKQQFESVKARLCLSAPDIDETYGLIQMRNPAGEALVLIEQNLAEKMKADGHPAIIGVFSNPKMDHFTPSFGGPVQKGPKGPGGF